MGRMERRSGSRVSPDRVEPWTAGSLTGSSNGEGAEDSTVSLTEVFWIFIILSALQPVLRQKFLNASRLRLLTRFEKKRGSRAIALVHRQETMALLGFPIMRYIDVHDSEEVLRAIKLTDRDTPIDLIMATKLASGTWTHDYAITPEEAKAFGLPVSTEMPEEIYEFMRLFPQPTRAHPSVEYVPLPHRGGQGPGRT